MPIYVYKCPQCGYSKEVIKPVMDLFYGETCETEGCKQMVGTKEIPTMMERQPTAAAVHFAGSGWAKDGYSNGS